MTAVPTPYFVNCWAFEKELNQPHRLHLHHLHFRHYHRRGPRRCFGRLKRRNDEWIFLRATYMGNLVATHLYASV